MNNTLSKKFYLSLLGFCCFLFLGTSHAYGAVEIFPESGFVNPAYLYNNTTGIIAIPSEQASNYTATTLIANSGDEDGFLIENSGNNLLNNIINDDNAILGYAWSERVGWLDFSHATIQGGINYYPSFSTDANGDQSILKGYIWNKYSGWIQLSSENFETSLPQTDTNWGVIFNGNSFSGRAWGAALGWIDFSGVTYDSTTGKFGGTACSVNDCTNDDNKIYFSKVPNGTSANTGKLEDWGVSKNMTSINDELNGTTCELLADATCLGNSPKTSLSVDNTGNEVFVNFSQRLVQNGDHDLKTKITNRFGQTYQYNDSLRIKSVVWPMNCSLDVNDVFVCNAPNLNFSTNNNGAIGDGEDKLELKVQLTNNLGEAIYADPLNNVYGLILDLTFEDTVEINQLDVAQTYNAISYYDPIGNDTSNPSGTGNDNLILLLNNTNGEFIIDITSLAPTNSTNKLVLTDFEVKITLDTDAEIRNFNFSKTNDYASQDNINLSFVPALTANISNFNHVIENTSSVFDVILTNHSPTKSLSQINLNTMFEGIMANLIAEIKAKTSSSSFTNIITDQLQLISSNFSEANYLMHPFNALTADTKILSDSLSSSTIQNITFDLKPLLVLGDQIDPSEAITFETEVTYQISGASNKTYHKSHLLDLQNNVLTSQIDIKGLASGEKIYDINKDYSINSTGNMNFGEISEEIRKNVANITRNETPGNLAIPIEITNWNTGNQIYNDTVLYYEGNGELIIGNGSDFVINDDKGSIIVIGGDVYIKSNLVYGETKQGSFGLIVIKDENGKGGNIYVDPAVTNLVGGFYAEGTMLSASDDNNDQKITDEEIYDGFSTNKTNLVNQLYINGTLISRNTIGGSRQNPVEYPETYSFASCAENSSTETQKCAERFDLNYMRNFATSGSTVLNGGIRANETSGISDSAFLIKYDPRIQTNIPPGLEMKADMNFEEIVL